MRVKGKKGDALKNFYELYIVLDNIGKSPVRASDSLASVSPLLMHMIFQGDVDDVSVGSRNRHKKSYYNLIKNIKMR